MTTYTITYTIETDQPDDLASLLNGAYHVADDVEQSTDSTVINAVVAEAPVFDGEALFHAAQRSSTSYHEAQGLDFSGHEGRYDPEFDCE